MKIRYLFLVLLIFACGAKTEKPAPKIAITNIQDYIGLRYGQDSNLEGIVYEGGNLLEPLNGVEYGVSNVLKDSLNLLWLEKLTHRDAEGKAFWEIRDVLVLPEMSEYEGLLISVCQLNNYPDPEIIAIGIFTEDENIVKVRKAWRANRQLEKFEEIAADSVICVNDTH